MKLAICGVTLLLLFLIVQKTFARSVETTGLVG